MAEIKKIATQLQPLDKLLDSSGDSGSSGQILSSTGTGTNWITLTGVQTTGATFSGNIVLDDNSGASPNIQFVNGANASWFIYNDSNGKLQVQQSSDIRATFSSGDLEVRTPLKVSAGAVSISSDGANYVTLTESGSGDFTIDAADDIRLDAGGGDLVLRTSGTEYGRISSFSNNLRLTSSAANADILLNPNGDGDVTISSHVAITGAALHTYHQFQSDPVSSSDGNNLFSIGGHGMAAGYSRNISIFSTTQGVWRSWVGTNLRFDGTNYKRASNALNNNWGNVAGIEFKGGSNSTDKTITFYVDEPENASGGGTDSTVGTSIPSAWRALQIDNNRRLYGYGNMYLGGFSYFGSAFYSQSNTAFYLDPDGTSLLNAATFSGDILVNTATSGRYIQIDHSDDSLKLADGNRIKIGTGNDLQLVHDGSNSFIQDVGTGNLFIEAVSSIQFRKYNTAEFMAKFINDGAVLLYHDNSKKFETTSGGVQVTGSTTIIGTNTFLIESNNTAATFNLNSSTRGFNFINNNATLLSLASDGDATFEGNVLAKDRLTVGQNTVNGSFGLYSAGSFGVGGNATFTGDVSIAGDLTVNGTTTTVNQTNLDVSDNIIGLNRGASSNANDSGIIIERGSTGDNAAFLWDESEDKFVFGLTTATPSATGNVALSDFRGIKTGPITVSGSITASGNVTANGTTLTGDQDISGIATNATAISGKLSKSGDTMTGDLTIDRSGDNISNIHLRRDTNSDSTIIADVNWLSTTAQGTDDRLAIIRTSTQGGTSGSRGGLMSLFTRSANSSGFNQTTFNHAGNWSFPGDISVVGTVDGVDISGLPTFTTVGTNFAQLGNVSVASYIRINADETLSYLNAAQFLSAIGGLPKAGGTMTGDIILNDNIKAKFGTGSDFTIHHNGTVSAINNAVGHIQIYQNADDKNIEFYSDDASGGVTRYFFIDGQNKRVKAQEVFTLTDTSSLRVGSNEHGQLFTSGNNTILKQVISGDIQIRQEADDADIKFFSDDGSGGVTEYFKLDGSAVFTRFSKNARFSDNVRAEFGDSGDLDIYHDATDSFIENNTGNLNIVNYNDDKDIVFKSDNGSGGIATYMKIDGGSENVQFAKSVFLYDNVFLNIGGSFDLRLYHDGNSNIKAQGSGNLIIAQTVDDADISFKCDDGSGGITEYFRVDGGTERIESSKSFRFADGARAQFGASSDMQIYHDGTDSTITNAAGDLIISNDANDGDIKFVSDDGSGGTATYMFLDGGNTRVQFNKDARFVDSAKVMLGTSDDLKIYHNSVDSYIENFTGELRIMSDDWALRSLTHQIIGYDTSDDYVKFSKDARWTDNEKAQFGDSADLSIYHDGSNSYIDETGTGNLYIRSGNFYLQTDTNENAVVGLSSSEVQLFHNGNEKFATKSGGVQVTGTITASGNILDRSIPCIINTGWGDDSSTTSNILVPLGNTVDDVSAGAKDGEHTFVAPYAGRVVRIIMKNTNGSLSTGFTTELKYYKNGVSTATSGELSASSSTINWFPSSNNTFAAGDEINIMYQKSAGGKYWREVSMTIVIELTDYDI